MLNIPIDNVEQYDEIESIDEVADKLGWTYASKKDVNPDLLHDIRNENQIPLVRQNPLIFQ